jgi:hypothetical protein
MAIDFAPSVSWYRYIPEGNLAGTANEKLSTWRVGTVDAGNISTPDMCMLIWNNRNNTKEEKADMFNCIISSYSNESGLVGTSTGAMFEEKWLNVRVDSDNETEFTPVGGDSAHTITAENMEKGRISGLPVEDPTNLVASCRNFARVSMHIVVPYESMSGVVRFMVRVGYQYT